MIAYFVIIMDCVDQFQDQWWQEWLVVRCQGIVCLEIPSIQLHKWSQMDNVRIQLASNIDYTVKPVLSGHSKRRPKLGFQYLLSLNAGQKYCRMHSAVLPTFIKLPFVFKTFVLSIFEWPPKTGFTIYSFKLI